jgi:hypothetical protein
MELNKKAAEDEADGIRHRLNAAEHPPALLKFGWVAGDYIKQELRTHLAYPTREVNRIYIQRWILDRWEGVALDRIRGADVEGWLDSPELQELSNGTKAKIRNILSSIYFMPNARVGPSSTRSVPCANQRSVSMFQKCSLQQRRA